MNRDLNIGMMTPARVVRWDFMNGVARGFYLTTMKKNKSRDIEKTYSVREFVTKLRRLADAVESRRAFTIAVAGEQLRVPAWAEFNIEHEREGTEEELEFQLRWKRVTKTSRRPSRASTPGRK